MVGTRSNGTAASHDDDREPDNGNDASNSDAEMAPSRSESANSTPPRSRRSSSRTSSSVSTAAAAAANRVTSLERLPRPILRGSSQGGKGSPVDTAPTATSTSSVPPRSSLRSRTSLERLPPPPPPAAYVGSPPRRSTRGASSAGAAMGSDKSDGGVDGGARDASGASAAMTRTSAELNALLGLDAANQRLGWPSREHSSSSSSSEEEEEEEELDRSRQWSRTSSGSRGVGNGSGRSRRAGKRPGNGIAGGAASGALTATRRPSSRRASGGAGGGGGGSSGGGDVPASVAVEVGRSKYGFRDRNTIKRTDFFTYERVESEEEDESGVEEEEEEEEGEEEEDEEEDEAGASTTGIAKRKQRRYKLRKRAVTKRQVFNITAEERLPRRNTRKVIPYDMSSQGAPIRTKRKRSSGGGNGGGGGGSSGREGRDRRRRRRHGVRRSHFDSSSESSDGGGGFADHDRGFDSYQRKTHERELGSIQPINSFGPNTGVLGGGSGGSGGGGGPGGQGSMEDKARARDLLRADVSPMEIDSSVTFDSIGGGKKHVRMLKEMVMLPLVYPELFEGFGAQPPKGVLFYGPPGTGKTLTARALANACSKSGHRISFFMRKGADCLSKWVGEAERQLRLLFEQARRHQPSIIFFDEIDGLAPVRSVKQDQIHASVVSTLLALMDGLDSRGQVIVIGATNRPDSLDPALRRPGRFDRELAFPLPTRRARREILRVHTKDWKPPLDSALEDELAQLTAGYCGADMKALCSEATLLAVRRRYPQIYASEEKLLLDAKSIKVTRSHFLGALRGLTPSSQREGINPARPLPPHLSALLSDSLAAVTEMLQVQFPQGSHGKNLEGVSDDEGKDLLDEEEDTDSENEEAGGSAWGKDSGLENHLRPPGDGVSVGNAFNGGSGGGSSSSSSGGIAGSHSFGLSSGGAVGGGVGLGSTWVHRPRLALYGAPGCGQKQLAAAALHLLDGIPVHSLALHSLYGDPSRTAEASLVSRFVEARRNVPSVLYLPGAHQWWDGDEAAVHTQLRTLLVNLLNDIPDTWPILVVSTWEIRAEDDNAAPGLTGADPYGDADGVGGGAFGLHGGRGSPASRSARRQLISALLGGSRDGESWGAVEGVGCRSLSGRALSNGALSGGGHGSSDDISTLTGLEQGEVAAGAGGSALIGHRERVGWNGAIEMRLSGDKQRERFVGEMLTTLAATLQKAFRARGTKNGRAKKAPPPPLPLAPPPARQEKREEPEDESLRKQDEHYLRELRICLREVLSELRKDRRFSMFKQIGDYDGEFMDLNGVRDKLNAEEYLTLDDFEDDLKLMAQEAKEVRDRLKADLASAEAHAAALESGTTVAASSSTSDIAGSAAEADEDQAVSTAVVLVTGGEKGEVDGLVKRAAMMAVDRITGQLGRASTAVDMACFLRDAALSFLQDCVSRLGYDLEGKCKAIAARKRARNSGVANGSAGDGKGPGPSNGKYSGSGMTAGTGEPGVRSPPNYTSESVIVDIYGGVGAQGGVAGGGGGGSRERSTRASRRSAGLDGRFVQLGDKGKLLEQGTEVEVLPSPSKRAPRQQRRRSPGKRKVEFIDEDAEGFGGEKAGAIGDTTQDIGRPEEHNDGEELVGGEDGAARADTAAAAAVNGAAPPLDGPSADLVSLVVKDPVPGVNDSPSAKGDGDALVLVAVAAVNGTAGTDTTAPSLSSCSSTASVGEEAVTARSTIELVNDAVSIITAPVNLEQQRGLTNGHLEKVGGLNPVRDGVSAAAASVAAEGAGGSSALERKRKLLDATPPTPEADIRDGEGKTDRGSESRKYASMESTPVVSGEDSSGDSAATARHQKELPIENDSATALPDAQIPTPSVAKSTLEQADDQMDNDGASNGDGGEVPPLVATTAVSDGAGAEALEEVSTYGTAPTIAVGVAMAAEAEVAVAMSAEKVAGATEAKRKAAADAEAAEAHRVASAAAKQQARADQKKARQACDEACGHLLDVRGAVVERTREWSLEQLLALRGGMLELGAALCGRGIPRSKARSVADAVGVLIRYLERRLP